MNHDSYPIWHPFTQMQTAAPPLMIERAEAASLYTQDGREILDAISSWWVTLHGHSHPEIAGAIATQAHKMEQVIFAGFTHPKALELSQKLMEVTPENLQHVFFTDDGSTAVEVAIKMAWQFWANQNIEKSVILSLEGAYHGDTFGAMSVSGRSVFTKAFDPLLFEVQALPAPGTRPMAEVIAAGEAAAKSGQVAALILEPLIQGAGGMHMYEPAELQELVEWAHSHHILVIFDEIMTGFYRTGKLFAANHITAQPDIMCLSKGLTGGFLPLAVTLASREIYAAFLSDEKSHALFHGHSFTANPIGCAAAVKSMEISLRPETLAAVARIESAWAALAAQLSMISGVEKVRTKGIVLAFELVTSGESGYLNHAGHAIAAEMMQKNIFMRPLGNVLYLMPPLCITDAELEKLSAELLETLGNLA